MRPSTVNRVRGGSKKKQNKTTRRNAAVAFIRNQQLGGGKQRTCRQFGGDAFISACLHLKKTQIPRTGGSVS